MKKLLSLIASIALVAPAASSVVSCGPKIEHDVLLLLPGDVMSKTSKITTAYQKAADEFNKTTTGLKVKAVWEPNDAVQERMSSFQQLPDLYVENGDKTSLFAYSFLDGDNAVRDMAKTINMKPEDIKKQYWSEDFDDLGKSGSLEVPEERTLSLSLIKSFDISVVNLKIFKELMTIAGVTDTGLENEATNLFNGQKEDSHKDFKDDLKTKWDATKSVDTEGDPVKSRIRVFFKKDENVLALTKLYNVLYKDLRVQNSSQWKKQGITNNNRLFPIGIDDVPNKIIYEYADSINKIDISDPKTSFLYSVQDLKPEQQKMTISINKTDKENSGYNNVKKFFNEVDSLRVDKNKTADKLQAWTGSMVVARIDGKTYTSNYFNQGTMLEASSSSAGTWAFHWSGETFDKDLKKYVPVNGVDQSSPTKFSVGKDTKDLMAVGAPTATGNHYNFMSQGPGLAGFKSVGDNATDKEKAVTDFVNYLRSPDTLSTLAHNAGYIPATSEALGKFKAGDPISKDFIDTYTKNATADGKSYKDSKFVSVKPNPAGGIIRSGITDIMIQYVFNRGKTIEEMFSDAKELWGLKYYTENDLLPSAYSASKVNYITNSKEEN